MTTPPSLPPQYSTSTGPHQSIMRVFTGTETGAAPCSTVLSDEPSNEVRTSSGSRSSRTNMVGTRCVLRTRRSSIRSSAVCSSHLGMITSGAPFCRSMNEKPSGDAW